MGEHIYMAIYGLDAPTLTVRFGEHPKKPLGGQKSCLPDEWYEVGVPAASLTLPAINPLVRRDDLNEMMMLTRCCSLGISVATPAMA